MKQPEYIERAEALENFERGMKAVFQVPKAAIVAPKKRNAKQPSPRPSRNAHPKTCQEAKTTRSHLSRINFKKCPNHPSKVDIIEI
jgi:hypothetical protein